MRLTKSELDDRLKRGELKIALIGMSNIGKSHWARRLKRDHGFIHYEVDDRIQEVLSLSSIAKSASWMGHPYEPGYGQKAAKYLELEAEMTEKANVLEGNVVIDTTGSAIYIDDKIIKTLSNNSLVVYLKAREQDMERLEKRFATTPKPLIWGDHFQSIDGMDDHDAMMSQYPSLLQARDKMYAELADTTLKSSYVGRRTDILPKIRDVLPDT